MKAAAWAVAFFSFATVQAAKPVAKPKASPAPHLETYQDLIAKAQNLTIQQDRLQASQVLVRGLQRETRGSVAYKELLRSLDDLASVFYTEKAQNIYSTAESLLTEKPRDAIDQLLEALKVEDRNLTVVKTLSRTYLRLDDCDKADVRVKQAEEVNPFSPEVKLLRLQVLACQKNYDLLATKLSVRDPDLEPVDKFLKSLQLEELARKKDFKKARAFLGAWETQSPDYPELYYWKWQISKLAPADSPDRTAAAKYSQLCQNLTPRKRKSFSLDVDLCKGKEAIDTFLREKENAPAGTEPRP